MKMNRVAILVLLAVCILCSWSSAQTRPVITSFHGNGELTWTNVPGTNAFTIQWASSLTGEWHHSWSELQSIYSPGSQSTAQVPMFYRVLQGFSDSSLDGPWLLTDLSETNHSYIIPDGVGVCTEWGVFNTYNPPGIYEVDVTGTVVLVLFERDHPEGLSLTGQFVSVDEVVFEPPMDEILFRQVDDPARCQGSWTGVLDETSGPVYPVTFDVTESGWIENFTGLPALVRGRLFAHSASNLACFLRTGADPETDSYNQVQITGTLSNDFVQGTYETDADTNDNPRVGSALLYRQ